MNPYIIAAFVVLILYQIFKGQEKVISNSPLRECFALFVICALIAWPLYFGLMWDTWINDLETPIDIKIIATFVITIFWFGGPFYAAIIGMIVGNTGSKVINKAVDFLMK